MNGQAESVCRPALVQEEIRFVLNPECIVSLLFTEVLDAHESLIITGAERFSTYSGYSRSFRWEGDYVDETSVVKGTMATVVSKGMTWHGIAWHRIVSHRMGLCVVPMLLVTSSPCQIVAIDAIQFRHRAQQFKHREVIREIRKAYAGYAMPLHLLPVEDSKTSTYKFDTVSTGNW